MKSIPSDITKRKLLKISTEAHKALPLLSELLQEEKKMESISFIEAASMAIIETTQRKQRRMERRQQRQDELGAKK